MEDSEVVKKIVEWCIPDLDWRVEFYCDNFEPEELSYDAFGRFGWTSERGILITTGEGVLNIPLTQFLMSTNTIRAARRGAGYLVLGKAAIAMQLSEIAIALDRITYYRDYFIKPYLSKEQK
jgi:hypothetical protein